MKKLKLKKETVVYYEVNNNPNNPKITYAEFENGISLTNSELDELTRMNVGYIKTIVLNSLD